MKKIQNKKVPYILKSIKNIQKLKKYKKVKINKKL